MTRKIISVLALLAILLTLCVAFVSCSNVGEDTDTSDVITTESNDDTPNPGTETNSGETNSGENNSGETNSGENNSNEEDTQKFGEFHFHFGN